MSVKIIRLGHRGDGVAAGPIFVPLTLPGEIVEGEVLGDRINAPKIVTPSSDRIRPPCPHFKSCGGCSLQHASDAFVENWKAEMVRMALGAQRLEAPITGVATSPVNSRRRAAFSGRRTKKGAIVGFHARGSDALTEIPNCTLLQPELIAIVPALVELTKLAASRKGEITLHVTTSTNGVDVYVDSEKELESSLRFNLPSIVEKYGLARLTWGDELVAERAPPVQKFGEVPIVPPASAFLQATKEGENALLDAVRRAVGPAKKIVDLFAGCGTFALPLSANAEIDAVETEPTMLAALDTAWRKATGLKKVTTQTRDLFHRPLMPDELDVFDAVIIDPPRAGAHSQFLELAKSDVPRIAAVSCNPVTFARDARVLVDAGFTMEWIEVVDQFRWSPHVELVALFTKPT